MIGHILKKDLQRLAVPIAVVWLAAGVLAIFDCLPFGASVAPLAELLNLSLPMAWAALIAVAVEQEPLTSDTAFWLTRPYRRGALVTAKVLFAAVAIHLPLWLYLVAIVAAHGVSPLAAIIWEKQLVVLLAVTAPAFALATITNKGLAIGASVITATGLTALFESMVTGPWIFGEWIPLLLGLVLLTSGAAGIVYWQYKRRTRWAARVVAVMVAACAAAASALLPGDKAVAIECALTNDTPPPLAITFDTRSRFTGDYLSTPTGPGLLLIPLNVSVSGPEPIAAMWVQPLSVRLSAPQREPWIARRPRHGEWPAEIRTIGSDPLLYQILRPTPAFLSAASAGDVRLDGRASVRPFTTGAPMESPVPAHHVAVPGIGTCSAEQVTLALGRGAIAVTCESARSVGSMTNVTLIVPNGNRTIADTLGYPQKSGTNLTRLGLLSPLDRRQALLDFGKLTPDQQKDLRVRITPAIPRGCANVDYSFTLPDLTRLMVTR